MFKQQSSLVEELTPETDMTPSLTFYTISPESIFSILFPIHFL